MRIHRLEIEGFGPFRDPQTLDIDRVAADGLFLLAGPTGAGKSSVLDAVSYALYDSVPRYDGDVRRVRSDHSGPTDPSRVQLEFSMNGERYRITRSPEYQRPAKRGGGVTTEKSQATLEHWQHDTWRGLAAKPRDVAEQLAPILTLTRDQFQQVILLAQNRFQRFLHAKDQERKELLRTLFRTERFEHIEQALAGRRQALAAEQAKLTALTEVSRTQLDAAIKAASQIVTESEQTQREQTQSEPVPPEETQSAPGELAEGSAAPEDAAAFFLAELARLGDSLKQAQLSAGRAEELERAAEEQLAAQERTAARQQRRAKAEEEHAALEASAEAHQERELRLGTASRAQFVAGALDRQQRAARALAAASVLRRQAQQDLAALDTADDSGIAAEGSAPGGAGETTDARTLLDAVEQTQEQLGELTPALQAEAALPRLRERVAAAGQQVGRSEQDLEAVRANSIELPERTSALRAALTASEQEAHSLAVHQGARARANEQTSAHSRAQHLGEQLEEAQRSLSEEADSAVAANAAFAALVRERQRGTAAELAGTLTAGEPCPVCGAEEHPAPARAGGALITEERLQDADDARVGADARVTQARVRESEVRELLAAARAEAGPGTPEEVAAHLAAAIAGEQAALAASQRATEQRASIQALEQQLAEVGSQLEGAVATLEAARASERTVQAALGESLTLIEGARADFPSVAAHEQALRSRVSALHAALGACQTWDAATTEQEQAEEALLSALEEQGFVSPEAAQSAALPEAERAALTDQSNTYRAESARVRAVLAEEELHDLPETPVNTEEAQDHRERARALRGATARLAERLAHATQEAMRAHAGWRDALARAGQRGLELDRLRLLADAVEGKEPNTRRMRLETFVLAARLEAIITSANARLSRMVHGRYTLQHDDELQGRGRQSGLGIKVLDEHTGRARSADSLSGGETFLVSLALALGLADVVTAEAGGVTLDTLFIDEGFGSLDPEALEDAMATLDSLREGGRTVAVISHVTEMKEQILARVEVGVNADGTSRLSQPA